MHKESIELMNYFVNNYLDKNKHLEILDVGSFNVNGSYRSLFENLNWTYYGLDIIKGPNVDIVSKSEYDFGIDKQFDVVISGNCLEHVEAPWKWIKEVEKVIQPDGILCIITPFSLGEHRYPVDCWRILPDGYLYLLEKESNFTILETKINYPTPYIKYKFFHSRPKLKWMLNLLPKKFKKVLETVEYQIQDTYVIARKNLT
jgi:SAM-dependent methyltransferase